MNEIVFVGVYREMGEMCSKPFRRSDLNGGCSRSFYGIIWMDGPANDDERNSILACLLPNGVEMRGVKLSDVH